MKINISISCRTPGSQRQVCGVRRRLFPHRGTCVTADSPYPVRTQSVSPLRCSPSLEDARMPPIQGPGQPRQWETRDSLRWGGSSPDLFSPSLSDTGPGLPDAGMVSSTPDPRAILDSDNLDADFTLDGSGSGSLDSSYSQTVHRPAPGLAGNRYFKQTLYSYTNLIFSSLRPGRQRESQGSRGRRHCPVAGGQCQLAGAPHCLWSGRHMPLWHEPTFPPGRSGPLQHRRLAGGRECDPRGPGSLHLLGVPVEAEAPAGLLLLPSRARRPGHPPRCRLRVRESRQLGPGSERLEADIEADPNTFTQSSEQIFSLFSVLFISVMI